VLREKEFDVIQTLGSRLPSSTASVQLSIKALKSSVCASGGAPHTAPPASAAIKLIWISLPNFKTW